MREGCGEVWGRGEEGELQQRDLQYVEVFITLADFDVGRLKESEGAAKKKKKRPAICICIHTCI